MPPSYSSDADFPSAFKNYYEDELTNLVNKLNKLSVPNKKEPISINNIDVDESIIKLESALKTLKPYGDIEGVKNLRKQLAKQLKMLKEDR